MSGSSTPLPSDRMSPVIASATHTIAKSQCE